MTVRIHPSAIVSSKAEIHDTVEIGPHVIIEDHVKIGAHTRVMANAYIASHTTIGSHNQIHMGAILGHVPQDLSFDPKAVSYLEMGNHNIIREYVTIHRGSKPGSKTKVGDHNFFMVNAHFGHDVKVGNYVVAANTCAVGGHAVIEDRVFLSGGVMIHQFGHVGRCAMISGNGTFSLNVPPFVMAAGRNQIVSINVVGLKRAGISLGTILEIKKAYWIYFCSGKRKADALNEIESAGLASAEAAEFTAFIRASKRPIAHHSGKEKESDDE